MGSEVPTRIDRIFASFVAMGLLSVLIIASRLTPSPTGFGTHEQLVLRSGVGLQACTWLTVAGWPCPTCGMTTSFAHAANGDLWSAFRVQPMGAMLALASATGFWVALHTALFASRAGSIAWQALAPRGVWLALAMLIGAWVYKILTWKA